MKIYLNKMRLFIFIIMCLLMTACTQYTSVMSNISEGDGNKIVAILFAEGISAHKESEAGGKVNILVSQEDFSKALIVLQNTGYPKPHYAKFNEIFASSSFTSSPTEEKARYNYLLSQSIEATLSAIDGVVLARVQIVLPERATFLDPSVAASAGVLLKYDPAVQIDWMIEDVKRLVADSVPGLVPKSVTVLLVPAPEMLMQAKESTPKKTLTLSTTKKKLSSLSSKATSYWHQYEIIIGVIVFLILSSIVAFFTLRFLRKRREGDES